MIISIFKKLIISFLSILFLSSCMTSSQYNPTLKGNGSGRSYVTINNVEFKDAKNKLIDLCLNRGLQIQELGSQTLICWKNIEGTRGIITQLIVGNSYSTPPIQKMQFSLTKKGKDVKIEGTRLWIETQMAFGQIRQQDQDSLELQNMLNYLKY